MPIFDPARAGVAILALLATTLAAQDAADPAARPPDEIETVLVTGEQPGPGLWKVSRGDHVMWILGASGALPKGMRWKSVEVEARIAQSQQVLFVGGISVAPDIGVFRAITLIPALLRAGKNPEGATLADVLPPATYAKWRVLAERYGTDKDLERWRPEFALEQLREKAMRANGLTYEEAAGVIVTRVARKHDVPVTKSPVVERRIHVEDPRGVLKRFATRDVSDIECFERDLDQLETRLESAKSLANAWASGDIDALREWHAREQGIAAERPCLLRMMEAATVEPAAKAAIEALKEQADIGERASDWNWMQAARKALSTHASTFAVLPMKELFDQDGYVAQLRAEGYDVEEP